MVAQRISIAQSAVRRREFLQGVAGLTSYGVASRTFARPRALRVGVVGGGIVGASIARSLSQAGAKVTLFEKSGPARGATENSFAWVNAFVTDAHYRSLRLQSLLAYRDLDRPLGLGMTWGGYANWASDAGGADIVRSNAEQLAGTPYAVRSLGPDDLAALSPALQPGPATAAFFSAIDGHLDPVHVTRRFLDLARQQGAAVIFPCEVQALEFRGSRLTGVGTSCGKFALDRLIVAAGVDTPRILAMVDFALSLQHAPGILAHSAPLLPLTPIICDAPGSLSFKQMADGSVVGTDAPEPPDTPIHREIRAQTGDFPDDALRSYHGNRILSKIGSFLPAARGVALERLTLGFRPLPTDGFPVMGALPNSSDVHVAVTHSGVTLAPIVARYTSDEVLHGSRIDMLAPYRPERFSTRAFRAT
jgi:glycine/D-amino acid oxidase-like deaminating enzyme